MYACFLPYYVSVIELTNVKGGVIIFCTVQIHSLFNSSLASVGTHTDVAYIHTDTHIPVNKNKS